MYYYKDNDDDQSSYAD